MEVGQKIGFNSPVEFNDLILQLTQMPYTLSHAIVALPIAKLSRHRIPTASVVIGAISPDYPYMLALTPTYAPGHSLTGPLVYCFIPSLLILFVWHHWLEKPNKALFALPAKPVKFDAKFVLLSSIGILAGAYSHVIWDATSHIDGALVINSDFWNQTLGSLPLYKWNQYLSGIAGMGILFSWHLSRVLNRKKRPYHGKLKAGALIYAICVLSFMLLANCLHGSLTFPEIAARSALGLIVGASFSTLIYAVYINHSS